MEGNKKYKSLSDEEIDDMCLSFDHDQYQGFMRSILKLASRLGAVDQMDYDGSLGLSQLIRLQIFQKLYGLFLCLEPYDRQYDVDEKTSAIAPRTLSRICSLLEEYVYNNNLLIDIWPKFKENKEKGYVKIGESYGESTTVSDDELLKTDITCSFVNQDTYLYIRECVDKMGEIIIEEEYHYNRDNKISINDCFHSCFEKLSSIIDCIYHNTPEVDDEFFGDYMDNLLFYTIAGRVYFWHNRESIKTQLQEVSTLERSIVLDKLKNNAHDLIEKVGLSTLLFSDYRKDINDALKYFTNDDGSINYVLAGSFLYRHGDTLTWGQLEALLNYLALQDYKCSNGIVTSTNPKSNRGRKTQELFKGKDDSFYAERVDEVLTRLREKGFNLQEEISPSTGKEMEELAQIYHDWVDKGYISESKIRPYPFYRFLTENCKLEFETDEGQVRAKLEENYARVPKHKL